MDPVDRRELFEKYRNRMMQLHVGGERKESLTLKQSRKQIVAVSINKYYNNFSIFFCEYIVL